MAQATTFSPQERKVHSDQYKPDPKPTPAPTTPLPSTAATTTPKPTTTLPSTTTTPKIVTPEPTKPPPSPPPPIRTTAAPVPPIDPVPTEGPGDNAGGVGGAPPSGFGTPSGGGFGKPASSGFGKPGLFGSPDGNNVGSYLPNLTPPEAAAKQRDDAIVNGFFYIFLGLLATIAAIIFLYCLVSTILHCLKENHNQPPPRRAPGRCSCACSNALNTYRAERSRLCGYSGQNRAAFSSMYSPNGVLFGTG